MWEKLSRLLFGKEYEIKERMFRTFLLMGIIATVVAGVETFLLIEMNVVLVCLLSLLILILGSILIVAFKYRNVEAASMMFAVVITVVVFPAMFCLGGGVESGVTVAMALGILYLFMMFSGKRLLLFLLLSVVSYGSIYYLAYRYPEIVYPLDGKAAAYMDSLFSMLIVGSFAGIVLKAHMKAFGEEYKQLVEENKRLEQSNKEKQKFFTSVSHEIRNPINTIMGLNELILRANITGETGEYAREIQNASEMLLNQVNDILDLSQIENEKMELVPVEYRTATLFRDLTEMLRTRAENKGLEFIVELDENLPAVLYGDEKRIKQIFLNILDNAVKYTHRGSVTFSVHREESSEGEIILRGKVADTGIGIRKEDVEHIYDFYNRGDEKRNIRIEGSGLGLAITKQLVDLMEGKISLDSIYTKGTEFTIEIKQRIVDDTPLGKSGAKSYVQEQTGGYRPGFEAPEARILIVDDSQMNTIITTKLLEPTRAGIDVVHSGAACLEKTLRKYYHVILMDYMMAEMNGEEVLREIRSQENGLCRDTAVVVMTAGVLSGSREKFLEMGFDGYVEKPIRGKLLEAEIQQLLPEDIVERRDVPEGEGIPGKSYRRRRKKVCITTDSTCDIPPELLEKYDIRLMHLYIKTPHGRFADTVEIDSDSLPRYMSPEGSTAHADGATVEEYERFFAEMLTRAEQVIHISAASCISPIYNIAKVAAQGFGNVHVIDSGQMSGGQGLVALCAARSVMKGKKVDEICEEIEKIKADIRTRFVLTKTDTIQRSNKQRYILARMFRAIGLYPVLRIKQSKVYVAGICRGKVENAWKYLIFLLLRKRRRISPTVVFVTHVGCSVKELEWIRNEILKYIPFERVIIQRASFSNSCTTGLKSVAISYYTIRKNN